MTIIILLNNMKLVILIRGYLYKFYKPISSYKKLKNFKYLINFTKLIERYELLINKLSQKYDLEVIFTSYDTTPSNILDLLKSKGWKVELYQEYKSGQFTNTLNSLKNIHVTTLIIRNDLVMSNKLINILVNFNYQDLKNLTFLASEPIRKNKKIKYIDVLCILPPELITNFISQIKLYSNNPKNGGHYIDYIPVQLITNKKWKSRSFNEYYQICRG